MSMWFLTLLCHAKLFLCYTLACSLSELDILLLRQTVGTPPPGFEPSTSPGGVGH